MVTIARCGGNVGRGGGCVVDFGGGGRETSNSRRKHIAITREEVFRWMSRRTSRRLCLTG